MEKIKSVLHGHKKDDDAAHDSHNTPQNTSQNTSQNPSSTTQGHQQTPIHDEMTGANTARQPQSSVQTTDGRPYTELAQQEGSPGLHGHQSQSTHGVPTQVGTDGPIGQSTPSAGDQDTGRLAPRPDAHPHSHTQDASVASIKSGIIGFGPDDHQGHAAMARHNPTDQAMGPKQVVGAGEPETAGRIQGSGLPGYDSQQPNPQTGAIGREPSSVNPAYAQEQQPYENTLRQESYTADTDRSFPLAGGVASRHHDDPTSGHASTLHDRDIGEREPGTKEKRVGFEDSSPDRDGHGRQALAGAAAAATGVAASNTLSRSDERDVQDQGLATRQATYGDEPPAMQPHPGNMSSQPTSGHNPAALAAAAAAATQSSNITPSGNAYGAQDRDLPEASRTASTGRPHNQRLESHHLHIPGEFPETPAETPAGEPNTFLNYKPVVGRAPPSGQTSTVEPTATLDPASGQRSAVEPTSTSGHPELRHTGTLDEPQPRSEDHHHGRDAAIAGGLGAGAAGLGMHAASQRHDTPDYGSSKPLYEEKNPYSSKSLDPRISGNTSSLGEQRFDPHAKTGVSPAAQMSDPSNSSAVSGPPVSRDTSDSQHHYGRDAAMLGTGAAAAGGLHHTLGRNDRPETDSAVPSQDPPYTSGPGSMSGVPDQTSNFSKPLPSSGTSTTQQPSGGKDTFYGTQGAPAPVADMTSQHQQPSGNLGTTSGPTEVPENQPEHHYGRDAGLAGAGAATAGGLYAANRQNRTDGEAAANTMDPYSSTPTSTRGTMGDHTTTGPHQSDTLNRADPRVNETAGQRDDHHYGRNAAAVGGAGAAGYGAYEAAKAYGDHRMTQPAASMEDQRYDPTASNARAANPVSQNSEYNYHDPKTASNVNRTDPNDDVNRNAALGGAGLAAAGLGAGAYAGSRHNDDTQGLPLRQKHGLASPDQQSSYPMQDPTAQQPYESTHDPTTDNHDNRNAALAGTAGAAGLGGAAYGYSQRHGDDEAAKRDALMKEKMEREQQEALKKDAHDRERDQHKLDKEQHKHEKAEEHRLSKEQRNREKEAEKETEGEEKKKGGLLGFLHRDKSKKEKKSSSSPDSSPRQSRDYSPRGSMDDSNPESPRWKSKHRLHKEPPKGHRTRESIGNQNEGDNPHGKRESMGTDGATGDPNMMSGNQEAVTDPHTGLPMDPRLGSGAGGTDGNPAIRGHHTHPDSQRTTN